MATKTANLYARIEPETKVCAESILESLGIPVSTAINMFYKQIILNNGNIDISKMTESQFNAEMEKAYQEMQEEKGISVESAFSSIKRAE